jgi:hypothetical protein
VYGLKDEKLRKSEIDGSLRSREKNELRREKEVGG